LLKRLLAVCRAAFCDPARWPPVQEKCRVTKPAKPLEGLRVLDFGHTIMGPAPAWCSSISTPMW
jgi:hypothetical protein